MKEIKAHIPMQRIPAVLDALRKSGVCDISRGSGCWNLTVSRVQRLQTSDDPGLQHYALDLAEPVVTEAKLELLCTDELADALVELISEAARTGRPGAGWILVSELARVVEIK